MALVSVTRLKLRSLRFLPQFLFHTWRSVRQLKRAAGYRSGGIGRDATGAFWTVTLWDDLASMRAYRNHDAHRSAMPKLIRWCSEAAVASWEQEVLPDPAAALEGMREHGRLSKVRHPSPAHSAGETAPGSGPPRLNLLG